MLIALWCATLSASKATGRSPVASRQTSLNPFGATLSRNLRRFAAFLLVLLLARCALVAGSRNAVVLGQSYTFRIRANQCATGARHH